MLRRNHSNGQAEHQYQMRSFNQRGLSEQMVSQPATNVLNSFELQAQKMTPEQNRKRHVRDNGGKNMDIN